MADTRAIYPHVLTGPVVSTCSYAARVLFAFLLQILVDDEGRTWIDLWTFTRTLFPLMDELQISQEMVVIGAALAELARKRLVITYPDPRDRKAAHSFLAIPDWAETHLRLRHPAKSNIPIPPKFDHAQAVTAIRRSPELQLTLPIDGSDEVAQARHRRAKAVDNR